MAEKCRSRKVVFLNFPTHGCINSLLATARELVSRGEQVVYFCAEEFREKIEQTGAEFRPYKGLINKFEIVDDDMVGALALCNAMTVDKLEHVDLFITHAGMNSVNEAICAGFPMITLPHQFEQRMISREVEGMGIGAQMEIGGLSAKSLLENSDRILNDVSFKNRAREYRELFLDEERTSHVRAADEIVRYVDERSTRPCS